MSFTRTKNYVFSANLVLSLAPSPGIRELKCEINELSDLISDSPPLPIQILLRTASQSDLSRPIPNSRSRSDRWLEPGAFQDDFLRI